MLVDITIIIYFIPFLYMFAAVIKLASRQDRTTNTHAVLIPGGKAGVWLIGGVGFLVTCFAWGSRWFRREIRRTKFRFEIKLLARSDQRDADRSDFVLARRAREEAGTCRELSRIRWPRKSQ